MQSPRAAPAEGSARKYAARAEAIDDACAGKSVRRRAVLEAAPEFHKLGDAGRAAKLHSAA